MIRLLSLLGMLTMIACDPAWGLRVKVQNPQAQPMVEISAALSCPTTNDYAGRTDASGTTTLGGVGVDIPKDCDLYVAAAGLETLIVPYEELCPDPSSCSRQLELVIHAVDCVPTSETDRHCDHFTHRLVVGKRSRM